MDCDANLLQCRQFSLNASQEPACTGQGRIKVAAGDFEPNPQRKKSFHHRLGEKTHEQDKDWMPAVAKPPVQLRGDLSS